MGGEILVRIFIYYHLGVTYSNLSRVCRVIALKIFERILIKFKINLGGNAE